MGINDDKMQSVYKPLTSIEQALNLDCRLPVNMTKVKKLVHKTKWFKKFEFEELTMDVLEEGYNKIASKYKVRIGYINKASEFSWVIMIKTDEGKWIETVYCHKFYEGMCKVLIVLYGYLIKGIPFKTNT